MARLALVPAAREPVDEETIEARFERQASLDAWVQANAHALPHAYEQRGDALTMLALADSAWIRGPDDAQTVDRAVAALAGAVGASVRINLEPACARLVWATERKAIEDDVLAAAEHCAVMGLAAAKRPTERDAADCVATACRFVRATGAARSQLLARFALLAERRLVNAASLVGTHLPFWRFPYAFRWARACPPRGRGPLGRIAPVDVDTLGGWPTLAYRAGLDRGELAEALEQCASVARRQGATSPRGAAALAELAEALATRWSIGDAASPADVVERLVPEALASPWADLGVGASEVIAERTLVPVLARHFRSLAPLAREHRLFRMRQSTLAEVA